MPRIFEKTLVSVSSLTSSALVDMGDALSPKYAPDTIAPPRSTGSAPIAIPIVMLITPMVAAVPKAVPVSSETPQFSIKLMSTTVLGCISDAA